MEPAPGQAEELVQGFPSEFAPAAAGDLGAFASEAAGAGHVRRGEDQSRALEQFHSEFVETATARDVLVARLSAFAATVTAGIAAFAASVTAGIAASATSVTARIAAFATSSTAGIAAFATSATAGIVAFKGSVTAGIVAIPTPSRTVLAAGAAAVVLVIVVFFAVRGAWFGQVGQDVQTTAQAPVIEQQPSEPYFRGSVAIIPYATTGDDPPHVTPEPVVIVPPAAPAVPAEAPGRASPTASPPPTATLTESRTPSPRTDALDTAPVRPSPALRTEIARPAVPPVTPPVSTAPPIIAGASPSPSAREVFNTPPPVAAAAAPEASAAVAAPVTVEPRPSAPPPPVDRPATLSTAGAAVVTPVPNPNAAIERTLKGYQAAFSRLDVAAVREVWPSVDGKALARAFDQLHSEDLTFDSCQVTITGATAVAACGGTTEYVPKVGSKSPRVERNRWRISLLRTADQWVVTRVDVNRP